jgi:lipopolysaccharide/colanic/teichoic acid biosynthesis glycosyltransferase
MKSQVQLLQAKVIDINDSGMAYRVEENPMIYGFSYRYAKRAVDIILSGIGLVSLIPVFAAIALLVGLTSRGPILYQWHVVGRSGRPFRGYKFRTMIINADELKEKLSSRNEMSGPVFKIKNDPRITPVGRFLRKLSLDELPQLWSVLKGDMSLVGPRPAGSKEWVHYKPWQRRKLSVTPGLSCLWQVNGRNQISNFDDWVRLDLEYIDNWSLWLDFKIIWKSVLVVMQGTGV